MLARLLYSEQLQLLDKKIKHFESARNTAEMNTQLIYEKLYSGKRGSGGGETLAEVLGIVLSEKITGKKAKPDEDPRCAPLPR